MSDPFLMLTGAVVRLLESLAWDDDSWAGFLSANPKTLADIRSGSALPTDEMMTSIICQVRRVQKSQHAPDAAKALESFWELLDIFEMPGTDKRKLGLTFGPDETIPQRFTRWTNSDRLGVAIDHLHRVPLARRREALGEVIDVLGKYVY